MSEAAMHTKLIGDVGNFTRARASIYVCIYTVEGIG